jgi:hypothetical protein
MMLPLLSIHFHGTHPISILLTYRLFPQVEDEVTKIM